MNEEKYQQIIKEIDKENKYEVREGMLYRIKGNRKLRAIRRHEFEGIMFMNHDHPTAGHFGIKAIFERIKEKYYWKGIGKDIEVYVKSCNKCQKRSRPQGKNELHLIRVKEPFYQIGIDIVG